VSAFFKKAIDAQYYIKRGQECLKKRDYHWALDSFSKSIEYFPDFPTAYWLRAQIYKKMGKAREAVSDCIKFLEVDRKLAVAYPDSSESLGPGQVAQIGMNLAGIPIGAEVLDFLGIVKEQVDISRYESLKINAKDEIAFFGIPALLDELIEDYSPEQTYPDIVFYDLALTRLKENTPQKKYYEGFAHLLLNDYEKATEAFDQAIEENSQNSNVYYLRGVASIKKIKKSENKEQVSVYLESAHRDFYQSLKNDAIHRICVKCGLREKSGLSFCMLCGSRLISSK
jgi:tetratricopeptide (TPR) repeat protein